MKQYSRVSYAVRCQIDAFLQVKLSIPEIARRLGYNKSTIYRELKRNAQFGIYTPALADSLAKKRYHNCRKAYLLRNETLDFVVLKLKEGWSPEQISGRLKREGKVAPSHTCIYSYIFNRRLKSDRRNPMRYRSELARCLRKYGRRGGGRYIQRKSIESMGIPIEKRPNIVEQRRRIGDWERDTMHTLNGVQVLVMNDRKSRFTKISILKSRLNREVDKVTMNLIKETKKKAFTITNDNGADFKATCLLPYPVYFCEPYKPQQRGTVENTIGLLRQYIKRDTDVSRINPKIYEDLLNNRPRKVLDYQTPHEVYFNKKVALASLI